MIPSALVCIVLALAAFRTCRLIGWDDLPPVARARAWATGETVRGFSRPAGQDDEYVYSYRRPLLAHFVGCAYCLGAWVSLVVYGAWLLEPSWTLYGCAPLALSAAVGLIARNLDP